MAGTSLNLKTRLARTHGRDSRTEILGIRLSPEELGKLKAAAESMASFTGEWARETLLREADAQRTDRAMFTELVALRQLLTSTLAFTATGKTMTDAQYQKLIDELRSSKHTTALEVLEQYNVPGSR